MTIALGKKDDLRTMFWRHIRRAVICIGVLALAGCAGLMRPAAVDPLALQLVEGIGRSNHGLKQYKALSHVRLELQQQVQSVVEMAMAAVLPNRMRVELLSSVGQPVTSMVADGETIHIRPHGKERIYRFGQSKTALERLIHIPLGVEQLQGVLIGRPALPEYAGADLVARTDGRVKVALKNRWHQVLAIVEFDADNASVRMLEIFDEEGEPLYRVDWLQWQHIGQYRLPSKLLLKSHSGHRVSVKLRRFWPNAALGPDTFRLSESQ